MVQQAKFHQNAIENIKEERKDAFKAKVEMLSLWEGIEARESSYLTKYVSGTLLTAPITRDIYLIYRAGKWIHEKITEGDEQEIPLSPFPIKQPEVYHFHPVAFVEQMKLQGTVWHDPVKNPQLNKYTYSGNINPVNGMYGHVRKWRTKIPSHSGLDIFAIPGTEIFACMDGSVTDVSISQKKGKNKTVRIKIDNTLQFINHMSSISYSLQHEDKGEMMGVTPTAKDSIYLIYMHLSEFKCKRGDKVKAGDLIALAGVTGNAEGTRGPHLHFEIATVRYPYNEKRKLRINPARAMILNSYDNKEQDEAKSYKYKIDGDHEKV